MVPYQKKRASDRIALWTKGFRFHWMVGFHYGVVDFVSSCRPVVAALPVAISDLPDCPPGAQLAEHAVRTQGLNSGCADQLAAGAEQVAQPPVGGEFGDG
jgi:hypothetical protein